ncbi:probable serine/threonine-protein kinase PIX13 [Vigna umbellata]|uniref:probable serine/threonine-protein kinase PIX13 n=1 Tax=Vigna umbellata TaxID=87088 RepID=UPI001F5E939A|nr:probable serine/threonine-protein kinase PIX13 [Vigna umbellata]
MGNCCSFSSGSNGDDHPNAKNHLGRNQFSAGLSNRRLIQNDNSSSRGCSSHFGGTGSLFGPSSSNNHISGNNTSTSFWGSENSHTSGVRDGGEFPHGEILNAPNLRVFTFAELRAATKNSELAV